MPDSDVSTWAEYREYVSYGTRFRAGMEGKTNGDEGDMSQNQSNQQPEQPGHDASLAAPGIGAPSAVEAAQVEQESWTEKIAEKVPALHHESGKPNHEALDETPMGEKAAMAKTEGNHTSDWPRSSF